MVKRLTILLVIVLVLMPLVQANALGISPSIFKLYFEPELERTFIFKVFSSDPNETISAGIQGDLAEYFEISKTSFLGQGQFEVHMKLPSTLSSPGNHRVLVVAAPVVDTEQLEGIEGVAVVRAPIDIFVPYPGKYIEAEFDVKDASAGEDTTFEIDIHNLGTDDLMITPKLDIYDLNNNKLESKILNTEEFLSKEEKIIEGIIDSSEYAPGKYTAKVVVDFGEVLELEDEFRMGQLLVNITDYSYEFITGEINKFDVMVESLWNLPLEGVHVEVSITENGQILDFFKTESFGLKSFQIHKVTGFLDTTNIEPGRYLANIKVFYKTELENKLVAVYVKKPPIGILWIILGIIAGIFLIGLFLLIIYLLIKVRRINKHGRKKKKRK